MFISKKEKELFRGVVRQFDRLVDCLSGNATYVRQVGRDDPISLYVTIDSLVQVQEGIKGLRDDIEAIKEYLEITTVEKPAVPSKMVAKEVE